MDTTLQDPLVGQVLDGRYRVDARIAVGGMATVYRALDTRLDRVLALKVMHPALAADGTFVERFIREAKSVARLAHPPLPHHRDPRRPAHGGGGARRAASLHAAAARAASIYPDEKFSDHAPLTIDYDFSLED